MSDLDDFLESRFTYRHTDGTLYVPVKDIREWMAGKVLVPVEPSREAALKEALQELYDYSGPPINQEWLSAMEKARELLKEAT